MTLNALLNDSKIYYSTDVFTAKKNAKIIGSALCGITLIVLGALALLNVGNLGALSLAGAWAMIGVGSALSVNGLGIGAYSLYQRHKMKDALMVQLCTNPMMVENKDVKGAQGKSGYFLFGKGEGLADMGNYCGVYINAVNPTSIYLFTNKTSRDAFTDQLSFTPQNWA